MLAVTKSNESTEWIVALATSVAAIGTVSAVLLALYRDTWRERRTRPLISLYLDPRWTEDNRDLFWQQGRAPAHWLRLRVENGDGRRSAQDVEVLVTDFRALGGDKEAWQPPLDTYPLWWSATRASGVQIPPGVYRYVDLLKFPAPTLTNPGGGYSMADPDKGMRTTGYLCVRNEEASVNSGSAVSDQVFESHRYRIELVVTARDIDSRAYEMEIEFDGRYRNPVDFWADMTLTSPHPIES